MRHLHKAAMLAILFGVAALLASCAHIPLKEREEAERARIENYAGQPIDHFTWESRYHGWQALSRDEALVWTTPRQAYLIQVEQPCPDLRFAHGIRLTHTLDTVYSLGLDYVKARGGRCPIVKIRAVDYGRMLADLRRERETRQATVKAGAHEAG